MPVNSNAPSLYELIADKITAHRELLAVARENCARWIEKGVPTPQRLREWDQLLAAAQDDEAAFQRVLAVLAAVTPADERLREFHPFAGILTREERRQARELCGYRH